MKAIVYTEYGSPDLLQLKEVAKPVPRDDELLIKIHAVSVNRSDWEGVIGKPLYARIGGLFRPSRQILGSDIAGRVEEVGKNVTQFQPGDDVFGDILERMGGFAEYVCAREKQLALKPNGSYYFVGGSVAILFQILLFGSFIRRSMGKNLRLLIVKPNSKDMLFVTELCEAGKIALMIDKRFRLEEVPEAIRYLGAGDSKGKIVITVAEQNKEEPS